MKTLQNCLHSRLWRPFLTLQVWEVFGQTEWWCQIAIPLPVSTQKFGHNTHALDRVIKTNETFAKLFNHHPFRYIDRYIVLLTYIEDISAEMGIYLSDYHSITAFNTDLFTRVNKTNENFTINYMKKKNLSLAYIHWIYFYSFGDQPIRHCICWWLALQCNPTHFTAFNLDEWKRFKRSSKEL